MSLRGKGIVSVVITYPPFLLVSDNQLLISVTYHIFRLCFVRIVVACVLAGRWLSVACLLVGDYLNSLPRQLKVLKTLIKSFVTNIVFVIRLLGAETSMSYDAFAHL